MLAENEIYFSTVLLDKNRWGSREPSILMTDWLDKISNAGFDGLELWENHLLKTDATQMKAVQKGPIPVKVLNTYCGFDDQSEEQRKLTAECAHQVSASAVKFNFGNDKSLEQSYCENLLKWRELLPKGCKLLCECHPYTVLENVDDAARVLNTIAEDVEIIVHVFGGDDEDFNTRLKIFDSPITHTHVAGGGVEGYRYSPLSEGDKVPNRIKAIKESGFTGSWTIEFCDGVASKDENIDHIFEAAVKDLNTLRNYLK
jgi:sugar phosphate isomerase/epimerase